MCGICGWIDWERDMNGQGHVLQAMTQQLIQRGPDDSGYFSSTHAGLGHRRLIVVDPLGGVQPMSRTRAGRTCTIVYNGELYNTGEIRSELKSRGWQLETRNSDTEALLMAYMEWGPDCLSMLNGIFALAIWDHQQETLFLARDRLGVKPLFFAERGSGFLFASEIKALLAHPDIEPVIDESGLAEILLMGPSRTPGHGIFKGLRELRPGQCLTFARQGMKLARYWQLISSPHPDGLDATIEKVRWLLTDTIHRQIQADVPVATFLSGGLDSSAVTALAAEYLREQGGETLKSFSVDYAGNQEHFQATLYQKDADFMWVDEAARMLKSQHHSVLIDSRELADALQQALMANDYPGMADIDSSLYLFCREVKREVTVALSGECADEIFGGYPWFHWEDLGEDGYPWIRSVDERLAMIHPGMGAGMPGHLREYLNNSYHQALNEVPTLPGEAPRDAHKRALFYLCMTRFMPTLLDRKDRMSMANSLEVRVPFADHRLAEYVWNVPWDMKNCDGQGKDLLRRALQGILPEFILKRPKSPYPKTHNPLYLKVVGEKARDILNNPQAPVWDLLDRKALEPLIKGRTQIFSRPWFGQLMGDAQYLAWIYQLNTWLETYSVQLG
ncbi:MAG TPA: asparagine synthase (glutamine-hydrolyzing) [Syntrophomonadaceae bacterium]|nr:asparagine synthase (glutamine-hydrolyzing) [Syntrophomonadaceae bacterium]